MVCLATHKPIKRWIIVISGFTERLGDSTGTRKLWRTLRRCHVDEQTAVLVFTWRDDWEQIAEFIFQESQNGNRPQIVVAAYSWGAGHGFIELAYELGRRGLIVDRAVLCDPVYYSWLPLWLARFVKAISPRSQITVPRNVEHVVWFRQSGSRLRGHVVVPFDAEHTHVGAGIPMQCDHTHADDQQVWHDAVQFACEEVFA